MFSTLLSMSGFDSVNKRYSYKRELSTNLDKTASTNTLKTINCVRTLPLIKSKSFSSVKSRNDITSTSSDPFNAMNTTRRRLSWFERRTWSFRRGNKRNLKNMESSPDITIIYSKDAFEWDEYLTECFSQMIDYQPLTILHERIENMDFPIGALESQNFANSRAVLLILSPDFLDFIDAHAEVFELSRLFNPKRIVVMLCGVQEQDISRFHKAALVSYDQWTCLVAKDQDKEFVLSVIQAVLQIIQQNQFHSSNKPQFKLSPRKVREGNGKVFILLENPISERQQIQILFDGSNENQLVLKWKNPYVLYFTIPDSLLKVARVVNISLICDNKNFIGTRPLKCETKMSELHSLVNSVNSPLEFMLNSFGFATLTEFDKELAKRFTDDKMFLYDSDCVSLCVGLEKKKSDVYFPSLLHFSSAYGLKELTSKLLECPFAINACQMRNSCHLTPAEIAFEFDQRDIAAILEDFQRLCKSEKINLLYKCEPTFESELTDQEKANLRLKSVRKQHTDSVLSAHHQLYGMSFSPDFLQNKERDKFLSSMKNNDSVHNESIYTQISNFLKRDHKNDSDINKVTEYESRLETDERDSSLALKKEDLFQMTNDKNGIKNSNKAEMPIKVDKRPSDVSLTMKSSSDFNDIHKELLYIIETFKKGMSFEKFESLFENWQSKHLNILSGNLSQEMSDSLSQIQTLCKIGRKQQAHEHNTKQFSFHDLKYYLSSKFHMKATDNALKNQIQERLQGLNLKNMENVEKHTKYTNVSSSLSSISTSSSSSDRIISVSNGSLFDSGNHSAESADENNKLNSINYLNNYYKSPKTKSTLIGEVSESQVSAKQLHLSTTMRCSKPPAPPPRPLNVSISEAKDFNESLNMNHHKFYVNQNNNKEHNNEELDSDDYMMPFRAENSFKEIKDECLSSAVKQNHNNHNSHNEQTRSHSVGVVNSHEYVNMISSTIESPLMAKRDPLTDYDLVPSGIPVPIGSLKSKLSSQIQSLPKLEADYDYDIPRFSQINSSNIKVSSDQNFNDDRNTDRQVFV